jgi:hypothetical protein
LPGVEQRWCALIENINWSSELMPVDPKLRRRCLVVSIEVPWPATTGGRARTSQVIRQLATQYDVTVIYPASKYEKVPELPKGVRLWPVSASLKPKMSDRLGVMPRLGKLALKAIEADLLKAIDEVDPLFIYWSHSYLAAVGMKITHQRLNVVEFANIEAERSLSVSRSSRKFRHKLSALMEYAKSTWWEPRCAKEASLVVSLHHSEAVKLRRYSSDVILVPNGIEQRDFTHSPRDSFRVLTMGSWTYEPNRIGLESFLRNDWPQIIQQNPLIELVILGRGASELFAGAISGHSNVAAIGFIEDPSSIFRDSFCFLAPALSGGGSQLKVSEALSFYRLVVGPKFLQREVTEDMPENSVMGTDDLARTIIRLSKSPEIRHRVENELQSYVFSQSWERNFAPLHKWLTEATLLGNTVGRPTDD